MVQIRQLDSGEGISRAHRPGDSYTTWPQAYRCPEITEFVAISS